MSDTPIKREVTVTPTVEELARCFAHLDNEAQAHFFNLVGSHFKDFDDGYFQMESIVWWDNIITDEGLWFIRELANRVEHHESTHPEYVEPTADGDGCVDLDKGVQDA